MFKYFLAIAVCAGFQFPWWMYIIAIGAALHENNVEVKWTQGIINNQRKIYKKGKG